jgi:hypothetical protein
VSEVRIGDKIEITGVQSGADLVGAVFEVEDLSGPNGCPRIRRSNGDIWFIEEWNYKLLNKQNNIKGEDKMEISNNIFEVFDKTDMKKVQERFGDQYSPNSDRDLLALKRDKKDLLAIIKKEEEEAEKD